VKFYYNTKLMTKFALQGSRTQCYNYKSTWCYSCKSTQCLS